MQNNKDMSEHHRVMIIGGIGAGKSSLAAKINDSEKEVRKTQTLMYDSFTIDTPGEYIENPFMYKNIIAASEEADFIMFVQDINQIRCIFPPGIGRSFNRKTFGVITKADGSLENLDKVIKHFREIGVSEPYFITSSKTGKGIKELKKFLKKDLTISPKEANVSITNTETKKKLK